MGNVEAIHHEMHAETRFHIWNIKNYIDIFRVFCVSVFVFEELEAKSTILNLADEVCQQNGKSKWPFMSDEDDEAIKNTQ